MALKLFIDKYIRIIKNNKKIFKKFQI